MIFPVLISNKLFSKFISKPKTIYISMFLSLMLFENLHKYKFKS